ncbi:hypothetical protein Rhopal_007664-T1 [Rhodotorula paludigena]|uniref:Uncharacterized protein n=1 Tax=Rhodotorula paludigena TaxID=86838 RepID=A0AAV5GQB5_9BASI|nr:hypothetical protein Rhopal_007664-T1 [Rhodotorula paludigena]
MHDLGTFDGADAGGSGSHQGLAFSLSKILAEKMARNARLASTSSSSSSGGSSGSGSRASGSGALEQSYGEGVGAGAAWLIQRCPPATMARLDSDGGCFCGKLDADARLCHGSDQNDRRAICVEDLRDDAQRDESIHARLLRDDAEYAQEVRRKKLKKVLRGEKHERSKRRRATCGIEFLADFEPSQESCPIGFARVGDSDDDPFICQSTSSPYSCGKEQKDCYAQPGVLQAECTEGGCEIMMCREGWRFHVLVPDEEAGYGSASCIPSKPLFFNPPA